MTTLSNGVTTLHPLLWMDYKSTREAGTVSHRLMSGSMAYSLATPDPRKTTIVLLFNDENASKACEDMLAVPGVLEIAEDGRDTHSMQFVVTGIISRELDAETAEVWIVSAEVQEVGA